MTLNRKELEQKVIDRILTIKDWSFDFGKREYVSIFKGHRYTVNKFRMDLKTFSIKVQPLTSSSEVSFVCYDEGVFDHVENRYSESIKEKNRKNQEKEDKLLAEIVATYELS